MSAKNSPPTKVGSKFDSRGKIIVIFTDLEEVFPDKLTTQNEKKGRRVQKCVS